MIVATIQNSGTHTGLKLFDYERRNGRPLLEASDGFRFCHLTDEHMPTLLEAAKHEPVITTWRDPAAIRATWRRNGSPMVELERQFENYRALLRMRPYVLHLGVIR